MSVDSGIPSGPLQGRTVLVIGRASGIARAVAMAARDAGAQVIAAGRSGDALRRGYADEPHITTDTVDVTGADPFAERGDGGVIGDVDGVGGDVRQIGRAHV